MTYSLQPVHISAMVLAAGASTRFGSPKQLLRLMGTTLVRKSVIEASNAGLRNIYVIGGAHFERVSSECSDLPCRLFFNDTYGDGIGNSISRGLTHILEEQSETQAVLVLHVDQPLVDSVHIRKLIGQYKPGFRRIVASAYSDTFGVPVVIDRYYFQHLKGLKGDRGAKQILGAHTDHLVTVPFARGAVDIDTKEDLRCLSGIR